jgi:hypothetical protein
MATLIADKIVKSWPTATKDAVVLDICPRDMHGGIGID